MSVRKFFLSTLIIATFPLTHAQTVEGWRSAENADRLMAPLEPIEFSKKRTRNADVLALDPDTTFQPILGIGNSLEHSTCYNLSLLPEADRRAAIRSIVHPTEGIGMNLMRVCIGTPDFTGEDWYSYNDMPPGETDPELKNFSIEKDRAHIIPVLKMALEENPDLRYFATPWSPPGWMTSTDNMIGGHLLPEHYPAYAEYFVKFIRAYEAEGIPIHAVTVQNEPGVDRSVEDDPKWFYPSCKWTGKQERDFIKNHLGPAFERHNITTEIWSYDHNFNENPTIGDPGISYPRTVFSDSDAAKYADGVAFHSYVGRAKGMTVFHEEFPEVPIYFTETSTFGVSGAIKIMTYFQNWARSYNAWVTILDENRGPNNGPFDASLTSITYDSPTNSVYYNFDFFMYAHFSKFIQRGALRIDLQGTSRKQNAVAFKNPDGTIVVVIANDNREDWNFAIEHDGKRFSDSLPPHALATYRWTP